MQTRYLTIRENVKLDKLCYICYNIYMKLMSEKPGNKRKFEIVFLVLFITVLASSITRFVVLMVPFSPLTLPIALSFLASIIYLIKRKELSESARDKFAAISILIIFVVTLITTVSWLNRPIQITEQPTDVPVVNTEAIKDKPPTKDELLMLVNAERAKVGAAPLIEDTRLNQSATLKAQDMVNFDYFDHVDGNGKHGYTYVFDYAPGLCKYASENLSWGDKVNTSQSAMNGWLKSPAHREAMLNDTYIYTGFGIVGNKIVEHFCQP